MNDEFERRAAIVQSLRAGKSPLEIISWFGYKKTQVYALAKQYNESDDKENFTADRSTHSKRSDCKRTPAFVKKLKKKINTDGGTKMNDLSRDMGVSRATISLAVRKDLGYNSFILRRRQLLTEQNKVNRKTKAQALLNDMKHKSYGFLRFFSDEKNFNQDWKVNRQNDR